MNGFRFRLDRVLDLRRTEMERAEAQLRKEAAEAAELDRIRAEVEAAGLGAELEVRAWSWVTGGDLAALGSYRLAVEHRASQLDARRAQARVRLESGRDAVVEARRRCRLLERLKERRLAEWQAARDRELETLAAESYLARYARENARRSKAPLPAEANPRSRIPPRPLRARKGPVTEDLPRLPVGGVQPRATANSKPSQPNPTSPAGRAKRPGDGRSPAPAGPAALPVRDHPAPAGPMTSQVPQPAFAIMRSMTPESPVASGAPAAPLTLEGASVLHQMMRFRRPAWRALPPEIRSQIVEEASAALASVEHHDNGRQTALYSLLGHKGDLLLLHFRRSFEELNEAELALARLRLSDYLEPVSSYLSIVELGLYESSTKIYSSLAERGVAPYSDEWNRAIEEALARQRQAMAPRLWPAIPDSRYLCFYPMDRRRGETRNWYIEPMATRQRMMHEHGLVGRRYAGEVRQIISGSIGFDDWEWGVDLFAEDPLVFKKLIYEMRFDEVSAVYALFGSFYVGVRVPPSKLGSLLT